MQLKEQLEKITREWIQATKEAFTEHPLAILFRQDFKSEIERLVKNVEPSYELKASVGAGNWANVPWLSIRNPIITKTTQDGIYPVYLFKADGSGFYLSLNQGTATPTKQLGKKAAEARAEQIKKIILDQVPGLKNWGEQEIVLNAKTGLGKSYEKPNISAKYYDASNIPDSAVLKKDLLELLSFYKQVEPVYMEKIIREVDLDVQQKVKEKLHSAAKLSKPFLLLAGISGTGKTRFVREQAKATGSLAETYCLTPVRPDWHEPSDLLGYTSRLNGKAEYITTDVLQFIAQAWRAKVDAGLSLAVNDVESHGPCLVASGDAAQLDSVLPYWLCLDEMNLAPVEQYFSDYLSILETREWLWTDNSFQYLSDPLLKASTIQQLEVAEQDKLREELGFADDHYDELWSLICEYGMGIPLNLIVAGTVNMDETTHGFSRKVIDRALSFDFGEFFPNDYAEFFEPTICNKTLSYPVLSHANRSQDKLPSIDSDGQKSINFLNAVNAVLDNTPFKLAYRALNELLLAVISTAPEEPDTLHLQAVWDDFLMCKVLPRIEGDSDKLMTDDSQESLLQKLSKCLITKLALADIWNKAEGEDTARPDLYREKLGATGDDKILRIACRSKAKLEWMQKRLERSGFTSFWP